MPSLESFFQDLEKAHVHSEEEFYNFLSCYSPDYEYMDLKPYYKEIASKLKPKLNITLLKEQDESNSLNLVKGKFQEGQSLIKLSIPLNGQNIVNHVTKIFNFIIDNKISHNSKLRSSTKLDDLVICVTNMADAKKIINFINHDAEICTDTFQNTIPFDAKSGKVSISYQKHKFYQADVIQYLMLYYNQVLKELKSCSLDDFNQFIAQFYSKKYNTAKYNYDIKLPKPYYWQCPTHLERRCDIQDLDKYPSLHYNLVEYQRNTIDNIRLLMKVAKGKDTLEDFAKYWKRINDSAYQEKQNAFVNKLLYQYNQGDYYEAIFGIDKINLTPIYSPLLAFYNGKINASLSIALADETYNEYLLEQNKKITHSDLLSPFADINRGTWHINEVPFVNEYGKNDIEKIKQILQDKKQEAIDLKNWQYSLIIKNLSTINEYFQKRNKETNDKFKIHNHGQLLEYDSLTGTYKNFFQEAEDNTITENLGFDYDFLRGPDYYLGFLNKLLELTDANLTSKQMQRVINQINICKEILYNFQDNLPNILDNPEADNPEMIKRLKELDISKATDLEALSMFIDKQSSNKKVL